MWHNLGTDPISILIYCGLLAVLFLLVGLLGLWIGLKRVRPFLRAKGYLRTPAGDALFRFVFMKQYEAFDDGAVRFFFTVAHFSFIGMLIAAAAFLALLGTETLLKG